MKKSILIAIGGMAGAILRYSLSEFIQLGDYSYLITFCINISGSFLLAFLYELVTSGFRIREEYRAGIAAGFLGAFTTFSAFCKETVVLMQGGQAPAALLYILCSVGFGLAAAYAGIYTVKKIYSRGGD